MGDHRASIKIEFEMHGIKDKMDAWVNYWPNDDGVDERVVEFFKKNYERAMQKYEVTRLKSDEAYAKEQRKAKYELMKDEFKSLEDEFGSREVKN